MNYNKKNDANLNEQSTILLGVRDYIVYFWAFTIGLFGLVFGQLFFLLPTYFISGTQFGSTIDDILNNFKDFLIEYSSVT